MNSDFAKLPQCFYLQYSSFVSRKYNVTSANYNWNVEVSKINNTKIRTTTDIKLGKSTYFAKMINDSIRFK